MHSRLSLYACDRIEGALPRGLQARVEEYLSVEGPAEPMTLRYIVIVDLASDRRVITAIEFISPANKTVKGAVQYRKKQQRLLRGGVSLVEVDLIRRGEWILAADKSFYPRSLASPYRICVTRSTSPDQSEVYRAAYDQPLPNIRIPLRPTDDDIRLPLQDILNEAYVKGRYGDALDYDASPTPPLSDEERSLVDQCFTNAATTPDRR